jgi:hypothetical protein
MKMATGSCPLLQNASGEVSGWKEEKWKCQEELILLEAKCLPVQELKSDLNSKLYQEMASLF